MIKIERFVQADEVDIRAFNARLLAGGGVFQFPVDVQELAVPRAPHAALWTEMWIARDETAVRGGFLLKHERLLTGNTVESIGNYQLPLSEGIIDRRYATVGLSLTHKALAENNSLYSLGMGSLSRPLPRLLERLGWRVEEVPFFFRVVRGKPFVRNIRTLQASARQRTLLRVLDRSTAASVGALTWRVAAAAAGMRARARQAINMLPVTDFDERADRVLETCRSHYAGLLDRGAAALNIKFPAKDPRLRRFLLQNSGVVVGWLVLSINSLKDHKQFGDLRLGTIVDGLAEPRTVPAAVSLAAAVLTASGADLLVSNQTHQAWQDALGSNLFRRGPSNFILARSPAFAPDIPLNSLHMNRGDGDGPINL